MPVLYMFLLATTRERLLNSCLEPKAPPIARAFFFSYFRSRGLSRASCVPNRVGLHTPFQPCQCVCFLVPQSLYLLYIPHHTSAFVFLHCYLTRVTFAFHLLISAQGYILPKQCYFTSYTMSYLEKKRHQI